MSKFEDVSGQLVGAAFTPDTMEKLIESKLEDLGVLVATAYQIDGCNPDYQKFERNEMAHSGSSMDKLGQILAEIFPGVHLTNTQYKASAGERDRLQLELVGNMGMMMDPEGSMDPEILKILHARRSAQEMRNDDGE